MDLTNEDVADILALLDSLPYESLDLQTPRFQLTLRRAQGGGWTQGSQVLDEPVPVPPSPNGTGETASTDGADGDSGAGAAGGTRPASEPGGSGESAGSAGSGLIAVKAPLPGTFYRAPRPGAAPFAEVGDTVSQDTVVAIVETMKLMNSVHAGTAGRVARIFLENGEFAPLGATLMLIEPDS